MIDAMGKETACPKFLSTQSCFSVSLCWKLSNGLDDLKVVPYIRQKPMDNGIHLEHSYLEVLE